MRIAISAGHGKGDPGAVNPRLNLVEHEAAVAVCLALESRMTAHGIPFFVVPYNKYTLGEKIAIVNAEHMKRAFDQAIEVHFNSNAGTPGAGTEVLHYSVKNGPLAARMSTAIARRIGTVDRGAKKRDGLGWLNKTLPPALIVEVLFLNNDREAVMIKHSGFASKVAAGIMEGLL